MQSAAPAGEGGVLIGSEFEELGSSLAMSEARPCLAIGSAEELRNQEKLVDLIVPLGRGGLPGAKACLG